MKVGDYRYYYFDETNRIEKLTISYLGKIYIKYKELGNQEYLRKSENIWIGRKNVKLYNSEKELLIDTEIMRMKNLIISDLRNNKHDHNVIKLIANILKIKL
jgi:mRNA degradation ribonuclease J1/J2